MSIKIRIRTHVSIIPLDRTFEEVNHFLCLTLMEFIDFMLGINPFRTYNNSCCKVGIGSIKYLSGHFIWSLMKALLGLHVQHVIL